MPYDSEKSGDVKKVTEKLRKTYKNVSDTAARQAIAVFNSVMDSTGDEGKAWASVYSKMNERGLSKNAEALVKEVHTTKKSASQTLAARVAARYAHYKVAGVLEDSVLAALRSGAVMSGPTVKTFEVTPQGIVANVEASVLLPATKETVAASLPLLPPAQVTKALVTAPNLLTMLPPEALAQVPFAKLPDAGYNALVKKVVQSGLSQYSNEVLAALLEGRSGSIYDADLDEWFPDHDTSLSKRVRRLVTGAAPEWDDWGDETYLAFTVKKGVLTLQGSAPIAWEVGRGKPFLKVNAPIVEPYVELSYKVYPTEESVEAALPNRLNPIDYANDWTTRVAVLPKGLPGVVRISAHFEDAYEQQLPLGQASRARMELLVRAVASG